MTTRIILDANILIRATLGTAVTKMLLKHSHHVTYLTADEAFLDTRKYVPRILEKHDATDTEIKLALKKIDHLETIVEAVPVDGLQTFKEKSTERLKNRDEKDWPYIALSFIFACPIWTEDQDFFGTGVPTWTTDKVHLYLESPRADQDK